LAQDRDLLQPHLKPLHLAQGNAIYRAGDTIPYVYFPYNGIVSIIVGVSSGQYVEAGMPDATAWSVQARLWTVLTR
jgi:CRP-like cAMP-binding protein